MAFHLKTFTIPQTDTFVVLPNAHDGVRCAHFSTNTVQYNNNMDQERWCYVFNTCKLNLVELNAESLLYY
jgi:hypothetical protein